MGTRVIKKENRVDTEIKSCRNSGFVSGKS